MKFNKIKNANEKIKKNSTKNGSKKKKKFYTQPKEDQNKFKTKVVMPKHGEDILSNSNWIQMQEIIKNQNEKNIINPEPSKSVHKVDKKNKKKKPFESTKNLKKSTNQTGDQQIDKKLTIKEKFKLKNEKRKEESKKVNSTKETATLNQAKNQDVDKGTIRKEKFKLKRKLKREHAKLKKKGDNTKNSIKKVKPTPSAQPKNELWFEVDQIYLEKAMNPGQPAQPLKEDDLIKKNASKGVTKVVGIDCEMVGVGPNKLSALARISIVNQFGHTIYDKYVLPEEKITDYRTFVSGIRPDHLVNGLHIDIAKQEVEDIIRGKLLVGHAVHNDLNALGIKHPKQFIRDTSIYFKKMFNGKVPSLKRLSETLLNVKVQTGEHSSIEDAKATMRLYTLYKKDWESSIGKSLKPSKSSKASS